ncbi:ABC transporter ATP-binding protein [Streptomyces nigrescens]|uniref:ABC transporter ATP-binding protein n=1 Tax=Streptomyces nigrescens TaxID=1920 RepID=A0ABY7IHI2_STRNI|nr:ABC transporter ATP-binding protein [Streptomyces libani]WAT97626.1 ABC transporter ATP-binding protein [Streptomyces libani subsp. libani]
MRQERTSREAVLSAEGIGLSRAGVTVLADAGLTVAEGEVVALLGPNGAGKTSLVECLEGFQRPQSGRIEVLGRDPWRAPGHWRARIGAVLQDCRIESELTVGEFTAMTRGYYPDPLPVQDVLAAVGLEGLQRRRVAKLSGGERRRLDIAMALIGRPELVFLDEPTTGLDAQARRDLWEMLHSLRTDGVAMLLTTHLLEEVEALADRVVILVRGRVRREGTVAGLRERSGLPARVGFLAPELTGGTRPPALSEAEYDAPTGRWTLTTDDPAEAVRRLSAAASREGFSLLDLAVRTPTFEDVYLDLLRSLEVAPR